MEAELLRDRIVCGVRANALRRQFLQKKRLTIQGCIDMCHVSEATASHLRDMGGEEVVPRLQDKPSRSIQTPRPGQKQRDKGKKCPTCGLFHSWGTARCPARGKTCAACGKPILYARNCRSKKNA